MHQLTVHYDDNKSGRYRSEIMEQMDDENDLLFIGTKHRYGNLRNDLSEK